MKEEDGGDFSGSAADTKRKKIDADIMPGTPRRNNNFPCKILIALVLSGEMLDSGDFVGASGSGAVPSKWSEDAKDASSSGFDDEMSSYFPSSNVAAAADNESVQNAKLSQLRQLLEKNLKSSNSAPTQMNKGVTGASNAAAQAAQGAGAHSSKEKYIPFLQTFYTYNCFFVFQASVRATTAAALFWRLIP